MNRFFINKQNGTKRNVINSFVTVLLALFLISTQAGVVNAVDAPNAVAKTEAPAKENVAKVAAKDVQNQSYTQTFQNSTTSLSGDFVQTNMYFSKVDYWNLKKAVFTMNFQVSQLTNRQSSDITLALNGIKFYSFRPSKDTGLQTKSIELPLKLIQGSNILTISGQILNQDGGSSTVEETPANWLTVNQGSTVNFSYLLNESKKTINSFYSHFIGMDTVANRQSAITVSEKADDAELTASVISLSGVARLLTTSDFKLPIGQLNDIAFKNVKYQLVIAKYKNLPEPLRKQVSGLTQKNAIIKYYEDKGKRYLIVTAKNDQYLKKAAQFIANEELMKQTAADTKVIDEDTQIFTSVLQYQGSKRITDKERMFTGFGHRSSDFFIKLPVDRTNADGSTVKLNYRYAKNLDFKRSLISIKVNGRTIASQRLSIDKADGDSIVAKLPKGLALGNTFTVGVVFDLETFNQIESKNNQTPWAVIEKTSLVKIKSTPNDKILFNNFPATFIKNSHYNNILVIRPKVMNKEYLATLTDIFNLLGRYVQSNTGSVEISNEKPAKYDLDKSHIIAFGSPKDNSYIKSLNKKLYFKYNEDWTGFLGNEKLSIESEYGKTIGTSQLLRSPYDNKTALLVVTGTTPQATKLASSKISTQAQVSEYSGDAVVADPDNQVYNYRFKKIVTLGNKSLTKIVVHDNLKLFTYLSIAVITIGLVILGIILTIKKNAPKGGKKNV